MSNKTVVVTGANGFIGSWIVKLLLERGYNVRGTVRNPHDEIKIGHLWDLPGAKERLTLQAAQLLRDGDFDDVIDGADFVVHTAMDVKVYGVEDPYKDVINPSVDGTLNVLRSAAKSTTVKRVAITSSVAAVYYSDRFRLRTDDDVVDESWWSDTEFCLREKLYYHAAKTLAERAAFEFVQGTSFSVVSIVPGNSIGTMLQKVTNGSSSEVLRILKGIDRPEDRLALVPNSIAYGDVEDVALAHILALENPNAEGRYLTIERSLSNDQLAILLAKHYPQYTSVLKPPMDGKDEETFMKPLFKFSNQKVRNLGISFIPLEESLKKTIDCFQQKEEI